MTRPVRVREADVVDAVLVAPEVEDRYATAKVDRYATAKVDRYATAKVDRYAAAKPDRYSHAAAAAQSIRYAMTGKTGSRKRIIKTTIVLVEPPTEFKGDMLYLPSSEYERAYEYEYSNWMDLWPVGATLNFTEAAEAMWESREAYGDYGDGAPGLLSASVVSELSSTFESQDEIWGPHDSELWPEALDAARKIRLELAADPSLVIACLHDYRWAGMVAGTHTRSKRPTEEEVLAALKRSTTRGLGAAAIDLIVWNGNELIPAFEELDQLVRGIQECDFVPEGPVENFILDSAELHNGTHRVQGSHSVWYDLFGEYVVAGVEYHSDLCRTQPYGWRNCRLVPHGDPVLPKFDGVDGEPVYPKAFVDRAQGALFDED